MSVEVILKNVYTFLNILQKIMSDDIQNWNKEMVENALKWGKYCSQLYHKAQDKPYKDDLDHHIQELGRLPWLLGSIQINLDFLSRAEDHVKEGLLQNSTLSNEMFQYVISLYELESYEGKQQFIELCQRMTRQNAILNVISLLSTAILNNDKRTSFYQSVSNITKAQMLLSSMEYLLQKITSNNMPRTSSFLKRILSQYAIKPGAMPILVTALKSCQLTNKTMENNVKTIILHTVLGLPTAYKHEFKYLMSDVKE